MAEYNELTAENGLESATLDAVPEDGMRMPEDGARSANGEDSGARRDVLSEQSEVLLDDDRRGSGAAADSDELWEEREGRNALRHVVGLGEMQDVTEVEYRKVRLERVVLVGVWSSAVTTQAQA